jgi:hypothetical protein
VEIDGKKGTRSMRVPAPLGLNEDQRSETFTHLLRESNAKCDRVIRTFI